jgi:nucleoside-diphosphate-sugar epimerase
MKIFLTGGTGYIGHSVSLALKKAGHDVTSLVRSDEKAQALMSRGIRAHKGDLLKPDTIAQGAREADGVIHTAATNDAKMPDADTAAVRVVLRALQGTSKPFVYTSGVWVMGNTLGLIADESKPLDPAPVVAWRAELERELIEAAAHGIRTVIIRPAMVYGRGAGLPAMLVQSARQHGAARYVGTGENHWPFVHVDDLAELYVLALEQAPAGSVYIGAHGDALRLRDVARAASVAAGKQGRVEAWALEEARTSLGLLADALALDQVVSGQKAKKALGWSPKGPFVLDDLKHGSYATQPDR